MGPFHTLEQTYLTVIICYHQYSTAEQLFIFKSGNHNRLQWLKTGINRAEMDIRNQTKIAWTLTFWNLKIRNCFLVPLENSCDHPEFCDPQDEFKQIYKSTQFWMKRNIVNLVEKQHDHWGAAVHDCQIEIIVIILQTRI